MKNIICDSIELANIDRSRLFDLINSVSDNMSIDKVAEITYYLQGKLDADTLPEVIDNTDYPNAKMISYNFFTDVVKFQYDYTSVRYFESERAADAYSTSGTGWGYGESNENHPFKAEHTSSRYSEMTKERWLNNGKY